MSNPIIEKLKKEGLAPTVTNYLMFNSLGEVSSLDQIEGEYLCDILEMIEDGLLVDTESALIN